LILPPDVGRADTNPPKSAFFAPKPNPERKRFVFEDQRRLRRLKNVTRRRTSSQLRPTQTRRCKRHCDSPDSRISQV
jgi:hypothetical protein